MKLTGIFYCCLITVFSAPNQARAEPSNPDDDFQQIARQFYEAGMEAARSRGYERAVADFEKALQAGYDTPRLHYNLGVVLLRMERYVKAARAFRRAAADPELAALAEYNLGLIALKRSHWTKARYRFDKAGKTARTPGLQTLSARALEQLPPKPLPYMVLAELAVGYDDAATIKVADSGVGDKKGDLFAAAWLYADRWLHGNTYRGVQVFGSLYSLLYAERSDFGLLLLETGAAVRHPVDVWETGAKLTVRHNRLGSDRLENALEFATTGSRLLSPDDSPSGPRLNLRGRFELIDGGRSFDYLSGTRQDARIRISFPAQKGRLTVDYTIERNNRDDLRTQTQFVSASPLRHRFGIGYRQSLTDSLDINTAASWRISRFSGKDTLADGTVRQREDNRLTFSWSLSKRRNDNLAHFIRGEWISNFSNMEYYDYNQLRLTFGTEWLF